ncbi:uncharacterized protein conserved in bacteria [Hahella chejuensis KCTC 2396]|uniref:Uncharacterized protein conserved in bacteria n=1 Tax=Hahella chejuensis (strain KCTC 2396) TaxID=349521 RepID=Q2SDW3_HAHCH|nr:RodZ domain-containing protein [Hahella chejuensis]ABC31161.1 uncharacterized protein conserved in bacteria [Hahella chejuensis KCTC 2396]
MSSEAASNPAANDRPGSRLRQARENLGWSIPETAERLHVIPRYVKAIEDGEHGQLPGLVFLKGYVRAYARLVNLSEDRVIEDLEQELSLGDAGFTEERAAPTPSYEEKPKSGGGLWLILLALAVAAGLIYYFLSGRDIVSTGSTGTTMQEPEIPSEVVVVPGGSSDAIEPPAPVAEKDSSAVESEPMLLDGSTLEEEGQEPSPEDLLQPEDTGTAETSASEQPPPVTEDPVSVEPAPSSASEQPAPQAAIGKVAVRATFVGDCWFDLRDKSNNRVVGLYRQGDVVDFQGEYPLRFIIGAVDAVKLEVNGKPLDFGQYRVRNNRVEMTLER